MNNQVQTTQQQVEQPTFRTGLAKINDTFMPMISKQLTGNGIVMSDYQKTCVLNSLTAINAALDAKGISINDKDFDRDNLTDVLLKVASLQLNPAATPREVYFQTRNVKREYWENGQKKSKYIKQIEMGIEGDGNDALLANFGRGVKTVHQYWAVREEDEFVYPRYRGIELTPPEWAPTGKGKVVRVVYPISMENGQVEYHIAEREDVLKNLIAHIKNNMMNEAFGIAKSRYDASPAQKDQIDAKKEEIINEVKALGLDAALEQLKESYARFISPAWKDEQSRESMILRKMRNNITKKIPKDFGNAFVTRQYDEATDEEYARVRKDITDHANRIPIDIVPEPEKVQPPVNVQTGEILDAEVVGSNESANHPPHVEQPDMYQQQEQEMLFNNPETQVTPGANPVEGEEDPF